MPSIKSSILYLYHRVFFLSREFTIWLWVIALFVIGYSGSQALSSHSMHTSEFDLGPKFQASLHQPGCRRNYPRSLQRLDRLHDPTLTASVIMEASEAIERENSDYGHVPPRWPVRRIYLGNLSDFPAKSHSVCFASIYRAIFIGRLTYTDRTCKSHSDLAGIENLI